MLQALVVGMLSVFFFYVVQADPAGRSTAAVQYKSSVDG
jgi:hypothetical protein